MKKITCCIDCDKRFPTCHASCEDYIRERKELDEDNEKSYKERKAQGLANAREKARITKAKYYKRRSRWL